MGNKNVTDQIIRIMEAKDDIKSAVMEAGVTVPEELSIDGYGDKVREISGNMNSRITAIEEKIPDNAASDNKLADKNFVSSSISNAISGIDLGKGVVAGDGTETSDPGDGTRKVSVKRDKSSESFLSVSVDGVKVSGIQTAISSAISGIETSLNKKQDTISDLETIRSNASSAYKWGDHSKAGYLKSVGDATITIKQDGTVKGSFTMNQTMDMTVNLTDTNTTYSSLTAASGGTAVSLVTTGEKYTWNNKQDKITSSNKLAYSLISGTPSIPTKVSQLTNDSNYATQSWVTGQGYLPLTGGTLTGDLKLSGDASIMNGNSGAGTGMIFFSDKATVVGSIDSGTTKALDLRSPTGHATIRNNNALYTIYDSGNANITSGEWKSGCFTAYAENGLLIRTNTPSTSKGVIFRNDTENFYLLTTPANDTSWDTLRPFSFNLASGTVSMGHDVKITGNLGVYTGVYTSNRFVSGKTGGMWVQARDYASLYKNSYDTGSWNPILSMKTTAGDWSLGTLTSDQQVRLVYITDANYNAGSNNITYELKFPVASGTIALEDGSVSFSNVKQKTINNGEAGWYRIFITKTGMAYGHFADIYISHSYSYSKTECIHFTISVGYGDIEFTQLNAPYINNQITKVRVSEVLNTNFVAIDIYVTATAQRNAYYIYGGGTGTLQTPTLVTTNTADVVKEFTLDNGFYINSKIKGTGFYKDGSSDAYVLLGGGGHKQESALSVAVSKQIMDWDNTLTTTLADSGLSFRVVPRSNAGSLPVSNNANALLTMKTQSGTHYYQQLALCSDGNMYHRQFANEVPNTSAAWKTVVDSANFSNFASASSSKTSKYLGRGGDTSLPMTFNWYGHDGQPTWLWGGEDGTNMYVYNPKNFAVDTATRIYSGVSNDFKGAYSLYYTAGQFSATAGNGVVYKTTYYPTSATAATSAGVANIMNLRLDWDGAHKYWHDIFASPNYNTLWHRSVIGGVSSSWYRIVQEDGGTYSIKVDWTNVNSKPTLFNAGGSTNKLTKFTTNTSYYISDNCSDRPDGSVYGEMLNITNNDTWGQLIIPYEAAGNFLYRGGNTNGNPNYGWRKIWDNNNLTNVSQLNNDANYVGYKYTVIDASALDENTWYPVLIKVSAYGKITRIEITNSLSQNKPSWATHESGFTCKKVWDVYGSNWGVVPNVSRTVYVSTYSWCGTDPVRGIGQLTNSANEYVYVRGGGEYEFWTSNSSVPVLITESSTFSQETIAPTTTVPDEIVRTNQLTTDNISWSRIVNRPTTLSGYGIGDSVVCVDSITNSPDVYRTKAAMVRMSDQSGQPWAYDYGQLLSVYGGLDTFGQLYFPYSTNGNLFVRSGTTSQSPDWKLLLSENNYFNYALPLSGGKITGMLEIQADKTSWREGIRIYPYNSWSTIVLGGNDLKSSSGTTTNTWSIHNNNGNFWIAKNGSDSNASAYMGHTNQWWFNDSITTYGSLVSNPNGRDRSMEIATSVRHYVKSEAGGWAWGLDSYNSSGSFMGSVCGTYGSNDTLNWYYFGGAHNDSLIRLYPGGDMYFKGLHNYFFNLSAVGPYVTPTSDGMQINLHNANNAYSASVAGFQTSRSWIQSSLKVGSSSSPSYALDVNGDIYTSGWSRAASGFYIQNTGVHFTNQGTIGEIDIASNNELCWGSNNELLYFNYRKPANGTTAPVRYIWNAGSSTSYAEHFMSRMVSTSSGGAWVHGRDNASVYKNNRTDTSWCTILSQKTKLGDLTLGVLGTNEYFEIAHVLDSKYNAGTNDIDYKISFPSTSGTLALLSNIPSKVSQLSNDTGYITGISKSMVENVLTGNITSHTHSQYLTSHQSLSGYATQSWVNSQGFAKGTIPSVGNGTVTIKQAGVTKGTFTMNQTGNTDINLTDTNTTYSSLTATSGGTAVSLVTTGEKYTWNNLVSRVKALEDALAGKMSIDGSNSASTVQFTGTVKAPNGFYWE